MAMVMVPWIPAVAAGSGFVDEANTTLDASQVFVAPGVRDGGAMLDALTQAVDGTDIAVAVFTSDVTLGANALRPTEILQNLRAEHPAYDTIVISIDGDLFATSRAIDATEAMTIANESEFSAGSEQQALVETVQRIDDATPAGGGAAGGGGFDGLVVGLAIGAAVLVAAVATPIAIIARRRRRTATPTITAGGIPQSIQDDIANLRGFVPAYVAAGSAGRGVAARAARDIDSLATNVGELFTRLGRRADGGESSIAAVEYDAKLRKLSAALHPDYLLDIVRNPHLWDDPDERIDEVQRALAAVSEELLQNIRQVNADRALQFQVSLDGLIGSRKELQDWDRDFRSAAGD